MADGDLRAELIAAPDPAADRETVARDDAGPLASYRAQVEAGTLRADPAQDAVAARLDRLWVALRDRPPGSSGARMSGPVASPTVRPSGLRRTLNRAFGRAAATSSVAATAPRGVYLVGAVGRGKSMLMDLFFATAAAVEPRRRRIHFHRFMQDVHGRMHEHRRRDGGATDPIPPLADAIAADARLLCFDEFQINDIADALILGRLFEHLFARGVTVVATSNTRPEHLFQGRPGADAFRPFIAVLLRQLDVVELAAARDYRRDRTGRGLVWHVPADSRAERALDDAFAVASGGAVPAPITLAVGAGRTVAVPEAAGPVARFSFDALCGRPLGPGDYLALASRFEVIVLDGVPRLGPDNFDRARRFITLVDALYEAHCRLVASAADAPDRIYERGENSRMFERTASRLAEMGSDDWLALAHVV